MKNNALETRSDLLVPTNERVLMVAQRLRWSPERAVARIKRALPAPLEQQVYLAIAPDFGVLPESMAKLLRIYLGHEELTLHDLEPRPAGLNLVTSKFESFAEFLRECLNLIKIVSKEYTSFTLSYEYAAMIVLHYGVQYPERLIELVDNNLEELCEMLGVNNEHEYSKRMRLCIWLIVSKVIPENKKNGIPDVLDISDILTLSSSRRRELRRAVAEEIEDHLSEDTSHLRGRAGYEILKREGII